MKRDKSSAFQRFTKMQVFQLISCRNILIYMTAELQKKLLPIFHYALNPGGLLFLGTSETIGNLTDLFSPVDDKWRISGIKNRHQPGWAWWNCLCRHYLVVRAIYNARRRRKKTWKLPFRMWHNESSWNISPLPP
jgi:hypothetical protein